LERIGQDRPGLALGPLRPLRVVRVDQAQQRWELAACSTTPLSGVLPSVGQNVGYLIQSRWGRPWPVLSLVRPHGSAPRETGLSAGASSASEASAIHRQQYASIDLALGGCASFGQPSLRHLGPARQWDCNVSMVIRSQPEIGIWPKRWKNSSGAVPIEHLQTQEPSRMKKPLNEFSRNITRKTGLNTRSTPAASP